MLAFCNSFKEKKNKDATSIKFSSLRLKLVGVKRETGIVDTSLLTFFHINKIIFISLISQKQFSSCITMHLSTETKTVNLRKIL